MTSRNSTLAVLTLLASVLLPVAGHSASFDCAKASTPTEHAICDNPQLSSLDEQTAGLYYTLISGGIAQPTQTVEQVKTAQAGFIQKRDACGANFNCLVDAYTAQVMYLNEASGKGM